jgi:hypothetical protein
MNHKESETRKTTDMEIITVVLFAVQYFAGNLEKSLCFVHGTGQVPRILTKSRFNCGLHPIGEFLSEFFFYTGQAVKELNLQTGYRIDSLPVSVCQNIRVANSRIVIGSKHDLDGFKQLLVNLPEESEVSADSASTDYLIEDMSAENGMRLLANRKSNSSHPHKPLPGDLISIGRRRVETAFSSIAEYLPEKIHAVTQSGFLIKLIMFIWAYTFDKLYKIQIATQIH